MRSLVFLFLLISLPATAKRSAFDQLVRQSGHIVLVRVAAANGIQSVLPMPVAGTYRLVVENVYRSAKLKTGDTLAASANLFETSTDTLGRTVFINQIRPGASFVLFLSKDTPRTFSTGGRNYPLYALADPQLNWLPYRTELHLLLAEIDLKKRRDTKR